jgi:hypothetical protein
MVFCSSQTFVDFLVELLKVADAALKLAWSVDLRIDRIRVSRAQRKELMASMSDFQEEPNVQAARCDVFGCATVTCDGSGSWHRPTKLTVCSSRLGRPASVWRGLHDARVSSEDHYVQQLVRLRHALPCSAERHRAVSTSN